MQNIFSGKRAAFLSLGCKVNSCETDAMRKAFAEAGAEIVEFDEIADIYVVNTCSVTNIADRKSRQMLHRAKKQAPASVVVATGCYAQVAGGELLTDSAVDVVIGNNRKSNIVEDVAAFIENGKSVDVDDISKEVSFEELGLEDDSSRVRAYIKIQDGCNQFCTYCIIPYARGRIRSRSEENVVAEAKRLAKGGYKEIVLTGIHISSYGMEREPKGTGFENNHYLLELVEQLCEVEGIERIRLGSLEPRIVTEEFASKLSSFAKVCPHFHLSLQSGCDNTLKRMNRHYTADDFYNSVMILRKFFERPAITTDVIVGFPQESEQDFADSRDFLEKVNFSKMHIFKYSRRKGTVADKMPGQLTDREKSERSDILMELDARLEHEYMEGFIGKTEMVLFEEPETIDGRLYFVGHNERYVRVGVLIDEERDSVDAAGDLVDLENKLLPVKITGFVDGVTLNAVKHTAP